MPGRKKPASPRSGSPARSGLRKPPRRATAVGGARRSAAAAPRKKIAARKPSLRRKPVQQVRQEPDVEILADETVAEATLRSEERPIAIAGQPPAGEAAAAAFGETAYPGAAVGATAYPGAPGLLPERTDDPSAPVAGERGERYPQDWFVAVLSLILAGTVFLPWYELPSFQGNDIVLSGWESGTWGPAVFFLALGSFALAVSRLLGIKVSLPLPHPTIHEGVGWIAIFAVLIKRLIRPEIPGQGAAVARVGQTWWILVPIAVGLALAFIAGRMTSGPPLVVLPGWLRGREGKIGLALALVAVLGGAAFGVLNSRGLDEVITAKKNAAFGGTGSGQKPPPQFNALTGKFPKCASEIPNPPGAKPETAVEQTAQTPCIWVMQSDKKPDVILAFYKDTLPKSGFAVAVGQANAAGSSLGFTGKKCGQISVTPAQGKSGSRIAVYLAPCPKGNTTPRPSNSPG